MINIAIRIKNNECPKTYFDSLVSVLKEGGVPIRYKSAERLTFETNMFRVHMYCSNHDFSHAWSRKYFNLAIGFSKKEQSKLALRSGFYAPSEFNIVDYIRFSESDFYLMSKEVEQTALWKLKEVYNL